MMNRRRFIQAFGASAGILSVAQADVCAQMISTGNHRKIFSGGSSVLPTTNLQAWWKADSLSASPVTSWLDSSSNGINLTNDSSAPVWTANQINGLPAVTFNGNTDFFHTSAAITYGGAISLYMVYKPATVTVSQAMTCNATGGIAAAYQINASSKQEFDLQGTTNLGTSSTSLTAGTWYELAVTFNGTSTAFYLNGVADGGGSVSSSSFDPINAIGTNFASGAPYSFAHGQLAELAIYNSSTYQPAVHTYFQARYGI